MEYHIRIEEEVQPAVRRIALKQIEVGIQEIEDAALDRHEVVHQIRKRCKKLRALLRLVRPCLGDVFRTENVFYRDLSRNLSSLRDAQALLESFDRTVAHFQQQVDEDECTTIRQHLLEWRDAEAGHEDQLIAALEKTAQELRQAANRAEEWTLDATGFAAFEGGLARTYRRGRRALTVVQANPTTESLHEWRKRVKYHWYHSRLLRRMTPRLIRPHRIMAEELGSLLGQDHDLAMLGERVAPFAKPADSEDSANCFSRLITTRRAQIQEEALSMGRYLFAEEPKRLVDRWRSYWMAWREVCDEEVKT
jgi:CHAD domain-containing protein